MVLGRRLSISSAADTRTVSLPAVAPLSKFAAAAVMVTVPDWTPTIRPALSTVAIWGLLLNQTNLTFGIGCESRGSSSCHAVALATVSRPRDRTWIGVTLTCTELSCSVG